MNQSTTLTALASTLTIGGAIGDGLNGYGLTINGPGTVALTGASTYSGTTTVNAGSTLNIGAAGTTGSIASSTALVLNGGTFTDTRITTNNSQIFTTTTLGPGAVAGDRQRGDRGYREPGRDHAQRGWHVEHHGHRPGDHVQRQQQRHPGRLGHVRPASWATTWAVGNGATTVTGLGTYVTTATAGTTAATYTNANIDVTTSSRLDWRHDHAQQLALQHGRGRNGHAGRRHQLDRQRRYPAHLHGWPPMLPRSPAARSPARPAAPCTSTSTTPATCQHQLGDRRQRHAHGADQVGLRHGRDGASAARWARPWPARSQERFTGGVYVNAGTLQVNIERCHRRQRGHLAHRRAGH